MSWQQTAQLDGVTSVDEIVESGPVVRLSTEIDLDLLLMTLADDWARDDGWGPDEATYIPSASRAIWTGSAPVVRELEPLVGWFRKVPCTCGEEHSWDLIHLGDERPEGSKRRGAFLGVWLDG
jgi:hypothetical protein